VNMPASMTFIFDATPTGSRATIVTRFSSVEAMEQTIPGMEQGLGWPLSADNPNQEEPGEGRSQHVTMVAEVESPTEPVRVGEDDER
jgi:hypothetical protein